MSATNHRSVQSNQLPALKRTAVDEIRKKRAVCQAVRGKVRRSAFHTLPQYDSVAELTQRSGTDGFRGNTSPRVASYCLGLHFDFRVTLITSDVTKTPKSDQICPP